MRCFDASLRSVLVPLIQICSACRAVRYCSAECQRAHWKKGHKRACATLRLQAQEANVEVKAERAEATKNKIVLQELVQ